MAIGTSWMFSVRRWAVTVISASALPLVSLACAPPAGCSWPWAASDTPPSTAATA